MAQYSPMVVAFNNVLDMFTSGIVARAVQLEPTEDAAEIEELDKLSQLIMRTHAEILETFQSHEHPPN